MIRKIPLIFSVLVLTAIGVVSAPILVHADIFLKPNKSAKEEGEKKSGKSFFFIPFQKKTTATDKGADGAAFYKGKTTKIVNYVPKDQAPPIDPELLRMRGVGPSSVAELQAIAAAYKAPKLAAMQTMRAHNAAFVAEKKQRWTQQAAALQTRTDAENTKIEFAQFNSAFGPVGTTATASKPSSSAGKSIRVQKRYTTLGVSKPKKVFTDYR